MDLRSEILREYSKKQVVKITNYIGNDQLRFDELMQLFLNDKYRVTQRAAWIVSHCIETYPELISPHLKKIILNLRKSELPDAVKRNTVRILQFIDIPGNLTGETADICFDFFQSSDEPIAVRCFSMTVLYNITKKEPGLKNELKLLIEKQLPHGSAGMVSRGKRILGLLNEK